MARIPDAFRYGRYVNLDSMATHVRQPWTGHLEQRHPVRFLSTQPWFGSDFSPWRAKATCLSPSSQG